MTSEQREIIRLCTLRHLDAGAGTKFGLSEKLLLQSITNEGFRKLTLDEFRADLHNLKSRGYIAEVQKGVSPENVHWEITAPGQDFYAQLSQ